MSKEHFNIICFLSLCIMTILNIAEPEQLDVSGKSTDLVIVKNGNNSDTITQKSILQNGKKSVLVNCGPCMVIERMVVDSNQLGFSLDEEERIKPSAFILDALSRCIDCEIIIASKEQIEKSRHCKAIIVRPKINSYKEVHAEKGQYKGKISFTLYFFQDARTDKILAKTTVDLTGDEQWGRDEPFLDAMEDVTDIIKDRICESNLPRMLK